MASMNNQSFKSSKMLRFGSASKKSVQTLLVTSMILGSLLVLTGGAVAESSSPPAWPSSIPWQNYTIAGEPVRDYEDKPYENDPTHGIANVQPKEVDIASGVDASGGGAANNPGDYTSVQWYYWDQLSDSSGFNNLDDDWLYLRMRVADDPTHGGKFYYSSYHWDILIDTDGDIWKEFVVDISGGDGYYKFGTVGVYYNDNETYEYEPDDDIIWAAEASKASNDYTRAIAIDYGPGYTGLTHYWIEYRIPVTSFKNKLGELQLSKDTPFRLFFSTSASMTNPLQKDWMAEYVFATPPNITVAKTVDEAYVDPGDVIHYKIYFNNTGESNAGPTYINDTLSGYVTYHSSSIPYSSISGNIYIWYFDTVTPGNHTLYLNVTANKYIISGTEIINYVHLDYTDESGTPFPDSEDWAISIVTAPEFELQKTVLEPQAYPGDTLHYEIHVTNTASGCAKEVWVNDTIPTGTTFKDASPMYYSMSNNKIVWYFENFCPGAKIIYLNVTVGTTLADGLVLNNSVELLFNDANYNQYPKLYSWSETTVIQPHISVEKTADRSTADPGDIVEYTFKIVNDGLGTASYIWINDTVPNYMTYHSTSPAYTSYTGNIISWYFTNVAPGEYFISLKLQVDVGTPDGTVLRNSVTVNYWAGPDLPYPEEVDSEEVTVTAPIMTIEKVADVVFADPDDIITYTITFKNTGNGTAGIVWVNDTIPDYTTYVSSNPTYTSFLGNTYYWKLTDVAPGTYTITLEVRVDVNTPDGITLENNVSLDYTDANGNQPYPTQYDSTSVLTTAPIITISKEADVSLADPGDIITYTIEYNNSGAGVAAHVWIKDTIPTGTTYVSSSPGYTSVSGNKYTWHFTDVGYGSYQIILKVSVDVGTPDGARLVNGVTLDYTDANGNQPYATQSDSATVTVTAPIMTIRKEADVTNADPEDIITYTIEFKNRGTGTAGKVWVNDTIPGETSHVSSTPAHTSVSGDTYTWYYTDLNPGTYTIILEVKVDIGTADKTILLNTVTLDYTDANNNPYTQENDTASVTVTAPIMTVTKVADVSTADPSDIITYTLEYKNLGTGVAANVWVNDTIPSDTLHVSSSPAHTSVSGNTYTWLFHDVNTGTYIITLKVKVKVGIADKTVLTNMVTLDYTDANGNQPYAQQSDKASVTVTAPIMTIGKIADETTADPDDNITYTIKYENSGTGVADHVWINDTIPVNTTYVSSNPAYTSVSGDVYTWEFSGITTGVYYISLKVKVDVSTPDKTVLINNVTLNYTDTNNNPYPQKGAEAVVIVTSPIMSIQKDADVFNADPGDIITYWLNYSNIGTGNAGTVYINDTIPAETVFDSSIPTYTTNLGNMYSWKFTNVSTGNYSIALNLRVKTGTYDGAKLENSVIIEYSDANNNFYPIENDTATVTATAPIMSINKVANVPTADPGDNITYTITYKNTGTGVAGWVWINDTIPTDTIYMSSTPAYSSVSSNTYTWLFTDVNTGTYNITLVVRVKVGTDDRTVLTNNVSLDYTDANGGQPYKTQYDTADVNVTAPVMDIQKRVSGVTLNTYVITDFRLRIAGEKWHDVELTIYDGNLSIAFASITRYPGDPDEQAVTIYDVKINPLSGTYYAIIEYTPEDDPINGQKWGANPCWLTMIFEDDTSVRLKHTFNVRHNDTWIWTIDDFEPYMAKAPITYEVLAEFNITYVNNGTGVAGHVWVNDTIPTGTTFASCSPNFTSKAGNTFSWYFTNVKPGIYYITLTTSKFVTKTKDSTNISLQNNVSLDYTDANGNQPYPTKHAHVTLNLTIPFMQIVKEVNPDKGKYGDHLTVTLHVTNNLGNATVKDYLPIELNYTGNALDDDGDGLIDEEAKDGLDNDGDGSIDEDLGNFLMDGNPITGGLNYTGHNLIFYPVPTGNHKITFDIMIVEKTLIKHSTTNFAYIIYNNLIIDKDTADITINVYNQAPTAIISQPGNNSKHYEDVPIKFKSDGSCDDGANLTYLWDFGDGNTSTQKNPMHTYPEPGTYVVTLTITDSASNSSTAKIQLIILKDVPYAKIVKPKQLKFCIGENITFEGKAIYHGNQSALNYSWDMGDNTSAYGKIFIYRYLTVGEYQITLTITDADGDFNTTTITIIITNETDDQNGKPDKPDKPDKPEKPNKPKQNNKYKAKNQPAESAFKPEAPFYGLPDYNDLQPNVPAVGNSQAPNGANAAVASSGFVAKNYQMITNGSSKDKKDDEEEPGKSSRGSEDNDENNDDNNEDVTG